MKKPILVIHGGAGNLIHASGKRKAFEESLRCVLGEVYRDLAGGLNATEAVTRAVVRLEDDPLFNAGRGSRLQSDGKIRMSASVMDGSSRRFGGCVNVEGLKNPVLLANALLKKKDRVLCGLGARRFARGLGLKFASPYTELRKAEFTARKAGKAGTVGAVALDTRGRLAAATSTGGRGFEYPFRVSDSPTCAGNFSNRHCAVSATGTGEEIVEFAAAATLSAWIEAGIPLRAASLRLLRSVRRAGAEFGWIAVDRTGRFSAQTTTPSLLWGAASSRGVVVCT